MDLYENAPTVKVSDSVLIGTRPAGISSRAKVGSRFSLRKNQNLPFFLIVTMDLLAKHIGERLSKNYRFCRIFENELERVWPVDSEDQQLRERRIKKIRAFADAHGGTANINDPGLQVTLRKKRGDAPGSSK
jgi:hypothetical protein